MELLVGAPEFWARARDDIAASSHRVFVQAMSFEGDAAGLALADALKSSDAADRRVLVDDYTRVNVNDRTIASAAGRRDAALQAEARATDAMFRDLIAWGVPVRMTNRIVRFALNYPARNHKKLIVADDVAYVGGVNFSDHNFAWPDLMLRIEGAEAAEFFAADFARTFDGQGAPSAVEFDDLAVIALDGRSNADGFAPVFEHIAAARREIVVVSPYLTRPFLDALGKAVRAGVAVRLLTPWPNNKPIVRDALLLAARDYGFEVILGPVMSHLKGLLIDGKRLIVGSSNFDFASLAAEEEYLAIVSDRVVIEAFQARVVMPALTCAIPQPPDNSRLKGAMADIALRVAGMVASTARNSRRDARDWGI